MFIRFLSPFGEHRVRFKDVILGIVLSSFSRGYTSLSLSLCLLSCITCRENNTRAYCNITSLIPAYALQSIPYILLACQSFNLSYYQKALWPQFANGFRFISSLIFITFNFLYAVGYIESVYPYVVSAIIAFVYNFYWDVCVCWSLFQKNSKNFLLRDKLMYPKFYYYFAIVSNFIFRANWTLRLFPIQWTEGIQFGLIIISVSRRIQHTIIRVENESINNPERYRKFVPIPEMTGINEDQIN